MHILVTETKALIKRESELQANILKNLQIIYDKKIHIEMGYSSLFIFCREELELSESSAYRKCQTVKMAQIVQDLPQKIKKGEISEQKIVQVARFIQQEKRLAQHSVSKKEVKKLIHGVAKQNSRHEVEKYLANRSQVIHKPVQDKKRIVAGGNTHIQFQMDEECAELHHQVRQLRTHHRGSGTGGGEDLNQLLKAVFKDYLKRNHPAHKGQSRNQIIIQPSLFKKEMPGKKSQVQLPRESRKNSIKSSRYIAKKTKQAVIKRDGWGCSFLDPRTKKRCNSTFRIQFEHINPHSMGGKNTSDNLTLLCQAHNLYKAQKLCLLGSKTLKSTKPHGAATK